MPDMRFHDGATGADDAQPPTRRSTTARPARSSTPTSARTPTGEIFFFTRAGYIGPPGLGGLRGRQLPGRRDDRLDAAPSGLASRRPGHAQPRGRRRVRLHAPTSAATSTSDRTPPTTKELFLRWAEWAALTPFFRLHGSVLAGTHTPWTLRRRRRVRVYRALAAAARSAPRPLILRLWRAAVAHGHAADAAAVAGGARATRGPRARTRSGCSARTCSSRRWSQQGATSRRVCFPRGCWQRLSSDERIRGPGSETMDSPLRAPSLLLPLRHTAVQRRRERRLTGRRARYCAGDGRARCGNDRRAAAHL